MTSSHSEGSIVGASAQAAWAGNVPMDAKVLFVENHQRVPPQLTLALAANVVRLKHVVMSTFEHSSLSRGATVPLPSLCP